MVKVVAERREVRGSSAARRLRRSGVVPGVVYGAGVGSPQAIAVDRHAFLTALGQHAVVGQLLELELDGERHQVKLQAVARHPVRRDIVHLDFLAVSQSERLEVQVPLVAGEGVRLLVGALRVRGVPTELPDSIELDAGLLAGGELRAGSVPLPQGVTLSEEPDTVVAVAQEG